MDKVFEWVQDDGGIPPNLHVKYPVMNVAVMTGPADYDRPIYCGETDQLIQETMGLTDYQKYQLEVLGIQTIAMTYCPYCEHPHIISLIPSTKLSPNGYDIRSN